MVRGFALLLLLQLVGEAISRGLNLPVPGNVLGMGLLVLALRCEWIKFAWIQEAADLLLANLALLFVPAGVGVMVYFDLIAQAWLPLSVATVVSSFVVMAVTG